MRQRGPYILYNLDRADCIAHVPESTEHDFCHVYDTRKQTPNPLTGKMQNRLVFSGLLPQCHAWIDKNLHKDGSARPIW